MIVERSDIINFLDADTDEETKIISVIQSGVEQWVKNYCHKDFESAAYAEYYNGNGCQIIQLDNYPITALTRVAIGRRSAIRVQNTSTYTNATVSVSSTQVTFNKDSGSTGVIFTTSTSVSAVVTAINALGSGWSATIEDSNYNNFASTELVEMFGKSAIDSNYVYLDMPNEAIDDFEVYPDKGELYRGNSWISGHRNVYVKYTAGYSATTMPKDLQLAVKILCKYSYQKREEETFGVSEYAIGDFRSIAKLEDDMPKEVIEILSKHKRILI